MSTMAERYDAAADRYERYWAPVLAPTAMRLIDAAAAVVPDAALVLDLGTGTGTLAAAALSRWPGAEVVGVDVSDGMLGVARTVTRERAGPEASRRLRLVQADAQRLPLSDGSVDVAISSFVLQLVLDRAVALRELHRVVRPGGAVAAVTWHAREASYRPDHEFDEAVVDLDIDEEEADEAPRAGDFPSADAAARQFRRAGFRDVSARVEWLEHTWTLDSYMDFKERYDEPELFASLDEAMAQRLRARARERLSGLAPDAFTWRTRVVFVTARRR